MAQLLFRDDPYQKSCEATVTAVHDGVVELDCTVFYPAGGGQPGDSGQLGKWRILDTRKGAAADSVLHVLEPGAAPVPGMTLVASLDWERRYRHMRFHTALHLLGAAVQAPVTGGRIAADKAHLDFDVEMDRLAKDSLEGKLNALVAAGYEVRSRWIDEAELDARPELVRTMSVAPPRGEGRVRLLEIAGIDLQACGGTHVRSTAEIGPLAVAKIRSEGKRNKRVTIVFAG